MTVAYQTKESAKTQGQRNIVLWDIAVLELLFASGVRVSELCPLQYDDMRLDEGEIKIYSKGAKERFVQIANTDVLEALYSYQEVYKDIMAQTGTFLSIDWVSLSQINPLEISLTSTVSWPEWKLISHRICSGTQMSSPRQK